MTAADLFIDGLKRRGVEFLATLCGHGLDPVFESARRAGLRLVDTRNEQTAAYAADAYGKLKRRPGVCAVSSGVAHINAMAGVLNAWFDGAPLLLLSGAGAIRTAGMGHFQDCDQQALAEPITRFSRVIDQPARVLQLLDQAWNHACGPPPGPVHLTFPMDIQRAAVSEEECIRPAAIEPARWTGDASLVADRLARASAPLIVAGSGVWYREDGEALLAFARRFEIPVVTPIWDRGCVPGSTPQFLGVVGAATGSSGVLTDADLIVMAGAAADYRVDFLAGRQAVRMDSGWDELALVYASRDGKSHSAWLVEANRRRDVFYRSIERLGAEQAAAGLHAIHIISALREILTDDSVLLIDGGSIGQWAHQLLCRDRYPGHWLTCGRSGVVGWGVGGAMGARMAFPRRPVVLLSGDGAFTFNVADIECAVRQKLPFVALVADDQSWGITQTGHIRQFGQPIASSLGPIAFDGLARAFGARGVRAETPEAIARELRDALAREEVTVIHVPIAGGNPG